MNTKVVMTSACSTMTESKYDTTDPMVMASSPVKTPRRMRFKAAARFCQCGGPAIRRRDSRCE
jgi:hypothetical protein